MEIKVNFSQEPLKFFNKNENFFLFELNLKLPFKTHESSLEPESHETKETYAKALHQSQEQSRTEKETKATSHQDLTDLDTVQSSSSILSSCVLETEI